VSVARTGFISAAAGGLHRARMLGPVSRFASWTGREPAFQVLTYHRVNDDNDPFFPALPVSVFETQMRYVAQTYTVLTVEELADRMRLGRVPRHAIALTFDDGYRDNLLHAAPILARYALRATIFLTTAYIGSGRRPWFDEVALAFKTTAAIAVEAPWGAWFDLGDEARRLAALEIAWRHLKQVPEAEFDRTLKTLLDALAPYERFVNGSRTRGMLDWKDVSALTNIGCSVGAHTATHPILSRLSESSARREIQESRDAIRAVTGKVPHAFAYPNGTSADYTPAIVRLVRNAGFTCAVTTRFGVNTRVTSPWELRRGGPWEHDLPTFALKLASYRLLRTGA
jgi:peptidoglycan/xylan/chitin deacetylase (PgdA/CDA1 family)